MPDSLFPEDENPRYFTVEERLKRFQTLKAGEPSKPFDMAVFHTVDDPITDDQFEESPAPAQDNNGSTVQLWVKFRHRGSGQVVVSKGCYETGSGTWHALQGADQGVGRVKAIAWAEIIVGEMPWTGPILSQEEEQEVAEE